MARQPAGRGGQQRTAVVLIVALALVALVVHSGRITTPALMVFCVLVPSVILHEVSHGWVASLCGDDTARRAGRLTLNPLAHVDVLGTIVVPAILVLSGVGAFGWAKPVPVNVSKLRHPRNQGVLVSLVGPGVNIALAVAAALVYRDLVPFADKVVTLSTGSLAAQPGWAQVVFFVGYVNVILAGFNLLPLPPLDGSVVIERLLPARWLPGFYRIRPFTLILPLALVLLSSFAGPGGGPLGRVFEATFTWWGRVVGI